MIESEMIEYMFFWGKKGLQWRIQDKNHVLEVQVLGFASSV